MSGLELSVLPESTRAASELLRLSLPGSGLRNALPPPGSAETRALLCQAERLGVLPAVSRELLGEADEIVCRTTGRSLWLKQEQTRLLSMLEGAGIRARAVKGVDLATALYPDLSWRWVGDVDLLVEKQDVIAAYDLLRSAGLVSNHAWTPAGLTEQLLRPELLAPELIFTGPQGLVVELHWDWTGGKLPVGALLDEPEDYLVYLCRHAGKHFWSELKWSCDIELFLRRYGAEIEWAPFWRAARKSGSERSCAISLELCRRWFGESGVGGLQQRLDRTAARLAHRAEMDALGPAQSRSHPVWRQLSLAPWPLWPALIRAWLVPPPQDWNDAHHQGRSRGQVWMRRLAHLWKRWLRPRVATVTFREWLFFMEAYGVLAVMEIARRTMNPQRLLGLIEGGRKPKQGEWTLEKLQRMAWLMNAAANRQLVPLRCLTRSLALGWMLRRRGADVKLRIGVKKGAGDNLVVEAHAWLEWQGQVVDDPGGQVASYTTLEGIAAGC